MPDNIQTSFSIAEDVSEHKIVGVTEFDEMENEITFENRDGFWWRKDIQSINFMIHIEIKALSGKNNNNNLIQNYFFYFKLKNDI